MARPKRGNYATGSAGQAKYVAALKKHLANVAKAKKAREITSTKKNIEKQKTAAKKTTSTKVKELAKKTTTAKRTTVKKPVASKTVAKTPATKTPVTKTVTKTKTPKKTSNNLKVKKTANNAVKTTKKIINKSKPVAKRVVKTVARKTGNLKKTVAKKTGQFKEAIKKGKAPRPKTPQQKFVSKVYQKTKKYGKRVLKKGGKDLLKIGKGILKNPKSAIKGGVAGISSTLLGDAINTRVNREFAKRKGMTLKEYEAFKKDPKNQRGYISATKKIINKVRGKSGESSTTKNINKQKKTNNNLSIRNIRNNKNKKNFYNTPDGKSPKAKEIATLQKNIKKAKGANKEMLQKRLNYLQRFGKMSSFTVNRNSKAEREARNTNKSVDAPTKSAKPSSARAKLRAKNEARFGKAHVDKLRAKNRDFQAMKKKKMTKAEFIERYPNSITAQKAKGLRK